MPRVGLSLLEFFSTAQHQLVEFIIVMLATCLQHNPPQRECGGKGAAYQTVIVVLKQRARTEPNSRVDLVSKQCSSKIRGLHYHKKGFVVHFLVSNWCSPLLAPGLTMRVAAGQVQLRADACEHLLPRLLI